MSDISNSRSFFIFLIDICYIYFSPKSAFTMPKRCRRNTRRNTTQFRWTSMGNPGLEKTYNQRRIYTKQAKLLDRLVWCNLFKIKNIYKSIFTCITYIPSYCQGTSYIILTVIFFIFSGSTSLPAGLDENENTEILESGAARRQSGRHRVQTKENGWYS